MAERPKELVTNVSLKLLEKSAIFCLISICSIYLMQIISVHFHKKEKKIIFLWVRLQEPWMNALFNQKLVVRPFVLKYKNKCYITFLYFPYTFLHSKFHSTYEVKVMKYPLYVCPFVCFSVYLRTARRNFLIFCSKFECHPT